MNDFWDKQTNKPELPAQVGAVPTVLRRPAGSQQLLPTTQVHELYKMATSSCQLLKAPVNSPLVATTSNASFNKDLAKNMRKMETELRQFAPPGGLNYDYKTSSSTPKESLSLPPSKRRPKPLWKPQAERPHAAIDIKPISGTAFNFLCKNYSDHELFSVTLQEIDSLLDQQQDKKRHQDEMTSLVSQLLTTTDRNAVLNSILSLEVSTEPAIPEKYQDYTHVFSKAESDILPPHRSYDHKIQLEEKDASALRYSPLYKMSTEELETIKEYLTDNLAKGFIEPF
jgi:hypothetical protein